MGITASFQRLAFLSMGIPVLLGAAAITTDWVGATSSDWNASGNWSNGVPNNGTNSFTGVISVLTNNPVTLATSAADTVSNLTLGTGTSLQLNGALTLAGAAGNSNLLSNSGNISVGSAGNLVLAGSNQTFTFDGSGTLSLADTTFRQGVTNLSGTTGINLFNNAAHTIQGYGYVEGSGNGTGLTITNHGTISAAVSGQILTLGSGGETTNNDGLLKATNGELDFAGTLNNTGGTVTADHGKIVLGYSVFNGNATGGTFNAINGGTLILNGFQQNIAVNATDSAVTVASRSVSGSSITLNGTSTLTLGNQSGENIDALIQNNSGSTINVQSFAAISGTLNNAAGGQMNASGQATLTGLTLTNDGDIRLQGTGGELRLNDSAFTIGGAGTVTLASSSALITGAVQTLTNANTIQGFGTIRTTAAATLNNQGGISANSSGQTLTLSGFNVNNTGTIGASNGGTLFMQSGSIANTGGTIAANGGAITMLGGVLGGNINATNGGAITVASVVGSANVSLASGGTLTNQGHFLNGSATVSGTNSQLDLSGGSTWTGSIDVGSAGLLQTESGASFVGSITVASGGSMKVNGLFLAGDTAVINNGSISVNGTLDSQQSGSALTLGGAGTLTLAGGTLGNGGSSSTATITNEAGHTITGSGTIQNGGFINYGNLNVGTGAVISNQTAGNLNPNTTFDNYGLVTVAGQLLAGTSDTMNFDNGGLVTLNGGTIGSVAGATASVVVNKAGSTIEGNGTISAASFTNAGNLIVDPGSQISVKSLTNISTVLGAQALTGGTFDVQGTLEIDNAAIRINNSSLTLDGASAKVVNQNNTDALSGMVLNGSSGVFSVTNGATEHLSPASNVANFGSVFVGSGSALSIAGEFDQETGQTEVNGTLTANSIFVAGGVLSGTGTVSGPVTVTAGGTVAPGDDPGALTINGNLDEQAGGNLQIELASATSYDQLFVNGNAQLDGTLTLILLDGFIPDDGESFRVITWASNSGNTFFSNVILPSLSGEYFTVDTAANGLAFTFHTPEPGTWFTGIAGIAAVICAARRRRL